jgi:hypothetical protein
LRALGGRVRSRIVSSSDFNNRAGSTVDPYLLLVYGEMIRILGPLLKPEHQSGTLIVEIPGETGTHVLDEFGGLTIRSTRMERDPIMHQVTQIISRPEDAAEAIARHAGGRPYTLTTIPTTTAENWFRNRPLVLPPLEICALKCGLLTFDHLLARYPLRRFTRFPILDGVRKFVRECIELGTIHSGLMHRHSLGMQYEKVLRLQSIRDQLPVAPGPFEHVLIASGDRKRRRIDLVWSIFGFDPFGFRLTKDYHGDDFTCVVVNRPLRANYGGGFSGPYWSDRAEAICVPTNFRSYPDNMTDAIKDDLVHQITSRRHLGIQRAIDFIERNADNALVERLKNEAAINRTGNRSLEAAFRNRLDRLFARRITSEAQLQPFTEIVDARLNQFNAAERGADITDNVVAATIAWDRWLNAYRSILTRLRPEFGLPGDVFTNDTVIQTLSADVRNLRDIPQSL